MRSGRYSLTLLSSAGIQIYDHLSGSVSGQELHINADKDGLGTTGIFTISALKDLSSNDGRLSITAADIQILGTLSSGNSSIFIQTANHRSIGLGTAEMEMDILGPELQRITALGLTLGEAGKNKNQKVVGVNAAQSDGVDGIVTFLAAVDDGSLC